MLYKCEQIVELKVLTALVTMVTAKVVGEAVSLQAAVTGVRAAEAEVEGEPQVWLQSSGLMVIAAMVVNI